MKQINLLNKFAEKKSPESSGSSGQMTLLAKQENKKTTEKSHKWELYVDGAARNNPGPAGAGLYLVKDGVPIEQRGMYLGKKTNNQAEYLALLLGVYYAEQHMGEADKLVIKSDSELLVRQISGVYKIKNPELARIYRNVRVLLDTLHYEIKHVPRELNKIADKLANMGIDKKIEVPSELLLVWPIIHEDTTINI